MKGKTAITGLLAMGIVIGLATLGLVYGNWTQSLTISGTVNTSSVDAAFKAFDITDYEDANGLKDIGDCSIDTALSGPTAVVLNVTGAYPNYWCSISGGVVNTGNMPIHVEGGEVTLKGGDPDGLLQFLKIDGSCAGEKQLMPATSTTEAGTLQCKYTVTVNPGKDADGISQVPEKATVSLNVDWIAIQFDKATKDGTGTTP